MSPRILPISRDHNPFGREHTTTDAHGHLHYRNLPPSLAAMLHRHVLAQPEVEAVVEWGGPRLTYADLWRRASRLAAGLRHRGLSKGDRVALLYPAGANWVVAYWGVILAGGVAVAPNTRLTPAEIDYVIRDANASITLGPDTPLPDAEPGAPAQGQLDDVATLFYTSGTTGNPKGVPFTQEGLMTSSRNIMEIFGIGDAPGQDIRTLISVPLFHVTGCNTQMMVMMYLGGTSIILPTFGKQPFIDALGTERINYLITVPAIYAMLLQTPEFKALDTSNVKWLAYGGAPIAPSLVRALKAAFPRAVVANGFGMTETTSIVSALPDQDAIAHADSIGYAVPAIDIAIALDEGSEDTGELLARGANVTHGYWSKREETAQAWHDGWYWSGDIVRADEHGRLYLIDRKKDIIIRGGENISSVEVEAQMAAMPGVAEAAALAVPDEILGEKLGLLVRPADGALTASQVLAYCQAHLARHKVPQYIQLIDAPLPRSAAGKILKKSLRDQIEWGDALW